MFLALEQSDVADIKTEYAKKGYIFPMNGYLRICYKVTTTTAVLSVAI